MAGSGSLPTYVSDIKPLGQKKICRTILLSLWQCSCICAYSVSYLITGFLGQEIFPMTETETDQLDCLESALP